MNKNETAKNIYLEWHEIDFRYESLRIRNKNIINKMLVSISANGLSEPVIVIPNNTNINNDKSYILLDGYVRAEVMKKIGKDNISANIWNLSEDDALIKSYSLNEARKWPILDEAFLLQELINKFNYSHYDLALKFNKSSSWISRRLQLLSDLPEFAINAINEGVLSTWCASRVVLPLARANNEHAKKFVNNFKKEKISTRQSYKFAEHYMSSDNETRDNLINNISLFFKATSKLNSSQNFDSVLQESLTKLNSNISNLLTVISEYKEQSLIKKAEHEIINKFGKIKKAFNKLERFF